MADLTISEKDELKLFVAERERQKLINVINQTADTEIATKQTEIIAINNKRNQDIDAL